MKSLVMGIDIGTQGARVLVVSADGAVRARANQPLPPHQAGLPIGWSEAKPIDWWIALRVCLGRVWADLASEGFGAEDIAALAVDSTSGTILPVDKIGVPQNNALLYNDNRSAPLVPEVRAAAADLETRLGYKVKSSFALPKILWLCREDPSLLDRTEKFIHAVDYVVGRLTGIFGITDHSNALKTGYDLINEEWPAFIEGDLGIPLDKLPRVVSPGATIGPVSSAAAEETRLSTGTLVMAGMTDGTAAQLASGAVDPGAWNSILGTTLVVKGLTRTLLKDPHGRFYSHRHPQGLWMPGGASNTGGEWILRQFPDRDPAALDQAASDYLPTELISYPLVRQGERFPFVAPGAIGFLEGVPLHDMERYAANLEGVAYVEKLAYDGMGELGADIGEQIYVTGGGARSEIWLRVRASVSGSAMVRPAVSETAMGAAILAAGNCLYPDLAAASSEMVKVDLVIEPDLRWTKMYADRYHRFVAACTRRGYLSYEN